MTLSWNQLASLVETGANQKCEYCRMDQALQGATFHVEHVIPKSRWIGYSGKSCLVLPFLQFAQVRSA
jgi:hypothetical protein